MWLPLPALRIRAAGLKLSNSKLYVIQNFKLMYIFAPKAAFLIFHICVLCILNERSFYWSGIFISLQLNYINFYSGYLVFHIKQFTQGLSFKMMPSDWYICHIVHADFVFKIIKFHCLICSGSSKEASVLLKDTVYKRPQTSAERKCSKINIKKDTVDTWSVEIFRSLHCREKIHIQSWCKFHSVSYLNFEWNEVNNAYLWVVFRNKLQHSWQESPFN